MKRLISIILVLIMVLGMCACGKDKPAGEPNKVQASESPGSSVSADAPQNFTYVLSNYSPIPSEVNNVPAFTIHNGAGLICCQELNDSAQISASYLASIQLDGSGFTKLSTSLPQSAQLLDMTADCNGNIWIVTKSSEASFELYELDAGYSVKNCFLLNDVLQNTEALTTGTELFIGADGSGNIAVVQRFMETMCYVFNESGFQFSLQHSANPMDTVTTAEGNLAVVATMDGGASCDLLYIDVQQQAWGKTQPLGTAQAVFGGIGENSFLVFDSAKLHAYNSAGESRTLFNWSELGLSAGDNSYLCPLENGNFAVLSSAFSPTGLGLYDYCTVGLGVDNRTALSMTSMQPDSSILEAVAQFNKTNEEYKIVLDSYFAFYETVSDSDWDNALLKLSTEMIAGKVPDIIDLAYLPVEAYVRQGILEDLRPYIQNDPAIDENNYFSNVFDALSVNGKLPFVTNSVYIQTIATDSRVTGNQAGWDYDAFFSFLNEQEDSMGRVKHAAFIEFMLRSTDRFVNWEEGTCDFNNPEFTQLLNMAKTLEQRRDILIDPYGQGMYTDDFSEAYAASSLATIQSVFSLAQFRAFYKGNLNMMGFPNKNGVCHVIAPKSMIGISALGDNKEGAWQFARSFLEERQQEASFFLPISKTAFDKVLNAAMNGNSMWSGVFWGEILPEDAELLRTLISTANQSWGSDAQLIKIVLTLSESFFNNEKSAEAVAADIQRRASIYFSEQS